MNLPRYASDPINKIIGGDFLHTIILNRYIIGDIPAMGRPIIMKSFLDEHGKYTWAKWKLKKVIELPFGFVTFQFKLDKRSIRHMQRVEVI